MDIPRISIPNRKRYRLILSNIFLTTRASNPRFMHGNARNCSLLGVVYATVTAFDQVYREFILTTKTFANRNCITSERFTTTSCAKWQNWVPACPG